MAMRPVMLLSLVLALASCDAFGLFAPVGPAMWDLAPGQQIGPETTEFGVLVTEQACAGGQSSEGRIVGPDVQYHEEAVTISFGARARGGAQTCPGNPPTLVRVTLREPLGERQILDADGDPQLEPEG